MIAVIPAYNEEESIQDILYSTRKYVDKIIVCDDGSTDNTAEIVLKTGATLVTHIKNVGKGEAIRSSFKEAIKYDPDIIITIDGDGQHDPHEIPKLIEPIISGKSDIVIGSRFLETLKTNIPFVRGIGLRIINFLHNILFPRTRAKDTQSGFRAFSKKAFMTVINSKEKGYGIECEQLILSTKNRITICEVPIYINYNNNESFKIKFLIQGFGIIFTMLRLYVKNLLKKI